MSTDHTPRVPEEAVELLRDAEWVRSCSPTGPRRDSEEWARMRLQAVLPAIHAERDREWRERLGEVRQLLNLEVKRCQELGAVWAEEGIDAEFPANPEDRARFFHGQRDKLTEVLAALDSLQEGDRLKADHQGGRGLSREERDALGKRVFDNAVFDGQSVKLVNWCDAAAVIETLESLGYTLALDQPPAPREGKR